MPEERLEEVEVDLEVKEAVLKAEEVGDRYTEVDVDPEMEVVEELAHVV